MLSKSKRLHWQMKDKIYKNNKNDQIYIVVGVACDATNDRDGNIIIIYELYSEPTVIFARDYEEFKIKFTSHKI